MNKEQEDNLRVSIIIPTLNRSDHVIKMLRYFDSVGFDGHVLIGDSSNEHHVEKTRKFIAGLDGRIKITYREYPGKKNFECIRVLLSEVDTPYVLWMCDDDILIPATLKKCARYLHDNPEYSAVGGVAYIYTLKGKGAFGEVKHIGRYRVDQIDGEKPSERLAKLLGYYSVVGYSLCRTKQFKRKFIFEGFEKLTDIAIAGELLPTCMCAVQGKVKMLDALFVLRQDHDERYLLPGFMDRITKPDWSISFSIFMDRLAVEMSETEKITIDSAKSAVKNALHIYLTKQFDEGMAAKSSGNFKILLSKSARFLKKAVNYVRRKRSDPMNMLLSKDCSYREDFIGVYNIITGSNKR